MPSGRVVEVLRDLVAIKSVNPAYPGGNGEASVASYVEQWGRAAGLDVVRQPVTPGRDNILTTLIVPGAQETLLFEAHMDTVALDPMGEPGLEPEIQHGRLHGRGACDTKGSLAAMIVALERLLERRADLGVNVALLAAVDEEYAFTGILKYIESEASAAAAVVGEPTDLKIVIAHKGCIRGEIHTCGRAAHSAEPEQGVNAIDGMADVLIALRALEARFPASAHALLGHPTFSVGLIKGGTGVNIVAAQCTVEYDRRMVPGERPHEALAELDAVLDSVRKDRPGVGVERPEPRLISESLETFADCKIVQAARAACDTSGIFSEPVGVPYGTDASKLQARRGIPAIVFGPGSIAQAHDGDEYVPIDHLLSAVEVYEGIALRFQGV